MGVVSDAEKAALAALNSGESRVKSWASTHLPWIIAAGIGFVLGFMVARGFPHFL